MQASGDDSLSLTSGIGEDDFRAALEEITSGGSKDVAAKGEEKAEAEPEPGQGQTAEAEQDEGEGEAEETEEAAADDEESAAESKQETDAESEDESDDDEGIEPPDHWTVDQKKLFEGVKGKEAKELVLDRFKYLDRRYDQKFQELARQRKEADEGLSRVREYERAIKPYESILAQAGATPERAAGQVMALWQGLYDDPVGSLGKIAHEFVAKRGGNGSPLASKVVRQVARQLNVNLEGLLDEDDAQSSDTSQPVNGEVAQLKAQIASLQDRIDSSERATHGSQVAYGQRLWEKFKDDPANIHAGRLEMEIGEILNSSGAQKIVDPAERLRFAYDRAVMMDPEAQKERIEKEREALRQEILADQEKRRKEQSEAVRRVPAQKAKAASTTPKPTAPVAQVPKDDDNISWKDAFRADFNEILGGGASRV